MLFRWIYSWLVPSLLALVALCGLWLWGQQMEQPVYDLLTRWTAREASQSPVVLVLIDDESLARLKPRFGAIPWARKSYVEVFGAIDAFKPAAIVFDGHFVNINETGDAEVFQALRRFPHLITGLVMSEDALGEKAQPGEKLANSLNTDVPDYYRLNLGVVSMQMDEDGAIRRLRPVYLTETQPGQSGIFPALSMAGVYEYLNARSALQNWAIDITSGASPALQLYQESRPEQGLSVPLTPERMFYLRWYKPLGDSAVDYQRTHRAVPLWKLMDPAYANETRRELSGKIALVGSSSTFYRDYHQTPVSRRHAGPDIHATAMDNILHAEAIRKAEPWVNGLILAVLFGFALVMRLRTQSLGRYLFYTLGTMIIYFTVAWGLFGSRNYWLDVVTPELSMVVAFLLGSTVRIFSGEKQLAVMEKNMEKLVSPAVFQEMRRTQVLTASGQKIEITSMFVDIRNFTTFAEHLPPAEVTVLLNEFYTAITRVVFQYMGTVDKFMGDGILIMFGAPVPTPFHPALALSAAQEILKVGRELSNRWRESKSIDAEIGISISSGPAFVGFLGPNDKMEYTAIGDTVNLCVRLQEQTKQFNTRLIVSESTVRLLKPGAYELIELDEVSVRGREATVKIFTLAQAAMAEPPNRFLE